MPFVERWLRAADHPDADGVVVTEHKTEGDQPTINVSREAFNTLLREAGYVRVTSGYEPHPALPLTPERTAELALRAGIIHA
jgi:hypothetical protein